MIKFIAVELKLKGLKVYYDKGRSVMPYQLLPDYNIPTYTSCCLFYCFNAFSISDFRSFGGANVFKPAFCTYKRMNHWNQVQSEKDVP